MEYDRGDIEIDYPTEVLEAVAEMKAECFIKVSVKFRTLTEVVVK